MSQSITNDRISDNPVSHEANAIFIEERPIQESSTRTVNLPESTTYVKQAALNESAWDIARIFQKPYMFSNGHITTAEPAGYLLDSFLLPEALFALTDFPIVNILQSFAFLHTDLKVKFQINTTRFHQGQIILAFSPIATRTYGETGVAGSIPLHSLTMWPHLILDLSSSSVAEFVIPYQSFNSFLPLYNRFDSTRFPLGQFYVVVLSPLKAASGSSTSLSYSIYLSAPSADVQIPVYTHALPSYVQQGLADTVGGISGAVVSKVTGSSKAGRAVGGGVKAAASVAKGYEDVVSGNWGSIGEDISGVISGISTLFDNLDRPNSDQPHKTFHNTGSFCHGVGEESLRRLSFHPKTKTVHPLGVVGDAESEMNLNHLCSIKTLINIAEWTTTDSPGTILKIYPINPHTAVYLGNSYDPVSTVAPSSVGGISHRFAYWRGTLNYRFSIVCSGFHTGRLLVAFVPYQNSAIFSPTLTQSSACPVWVLDIQESSDFTITVPYASTTAWKLISGDYQWTDITGGTMTVPNSSNQDNSTGTLYVSVLNELAAPNNVSTSVQILTWLGAGDDFELMQPNDVSTLVLQSNINNSAPTYYSPPIGADSSEYYQQGSNEPVTILKNREDDVEDPDQNNPLQTSQPCNEMAPFFIGERHMHLKYLLRRYSAFAWNSFTPNTTINSYYLNINNTPLIPYSSCLDTTALPLYRFFYTTLSYFASMFVFWRGSLRYKILHNGPTTTGNIIMVDHIPVSYDDWQQGAIATLPTVAYQTFPSASVHGFDVRGPGFDQTCEVELPFSTPHQILSTWPNLNSHLDPTHPSTNSAGQLRVVVNMTRNGTIDLLSIWQAAGDDFVFTQYMGMPVQQIPWTGQAGS